MRWAFEGKDQIGQELTDFICSVEKVTWQSEYDLMRWCFRALRGYIQIGQVLTDFVCIIVWKR